MTRKKAKQKKQVDTLLEKLVNSLSFVYSHFYFPCHSNGLKAVARTLGYVWSEQDGSGIQSIVWRRKWDETHEESLKERLLTYNLDDCAALRRVTEFMRTISQNSQRSQSPAASENDLPDVALVNDIEDNPVWNMWGRGTYFHPAFEYVNKCAYFDYQRERVYVRSSTTIKKMLAKGKKQRNGRLPVSKRVVIRCSKCPKCNSRQLTTTKMRGRPKIKRTYDLVITASGMKRRVIECSTPTQKCLDCHTTFVAQRYQNLARHSHALMSWAMFQHIDCRLSLRTIETLFREFFDLCIYLPELGSFKSLMARYYKMTHKSLFRSLLSGSVLHVDETEVNIRSGKAYVWVFTNLEEVVYMYRPNREGEFLKDLLRGFEGVLVSDFYAAYDSVLCPQQKCLVHLMRDMNQDLLSNPFDQELQSITEGFGELLRSIVCTVDRFGLKRRHLKKHHANIANYIQLISSQTFRSESASKLQRRMLKYSDKLFTFAYYDGVSWNNNNAENAIRRFAYYREGTSGLMSEQGLKDYLVLLSICHTCYYKGVSFLQFLLSRTRRVDEICQGRRRSRRAPVIEVYPKGFEDPHSRGAANKR